MHHTHPPTLHLSPPQCLWQNIFALLFVCAWVCVLWSAFISLQTCKHIRSVFQWMCTYTRTHSFVDTEVHKCMAKCAGVCDICMHDVCVPMRYVWRAIWSSLPCHGPCEVLSAWPLRSPVATEGLLHSTSSPGSRPQKRKFGSLKWRGCSRAIYRALYRSSATHDIPYEKQCVWGACGVVCVWVLGVEGGGGVSVRVYVNACAFTRKCRL